MIADRFITRLSRPYGHVYRAAILLDISPEQLVKIRASQAVASQLARSTFAMRLTGGLVLLAVAWLLYGLLNALTRGYYRVLAGLVAGGVVVVLVFATFIQWSRPRPAAPQIRTLEDSAGDAVLITR